jgi:hypothetical protein
MILYAGGILIRSRSWQAVTPKSVQDANAGRGADSNNSQAPLVSVLMRAKVKLPRLDPNSRGIRPVAVCACRRCVSPTPSKRRYSLTMADEANNGVGIPVANPAQLHLQSSGGDSGGMRVVASLVEAVRHVRGGGARRAGTARCTVPPDDLHCTPAITPLRCDWSDAFTSFAPQSNIEWDWPNRIARRLKIPE